MHHHPRPTVRSSSIVVAILLLFAVVHAPSAFAGQRQGAPSADGGRCNPKKSDCRIDSTPPDITISSPSTGAPVARDITVTGVASDDTGVSTVEVRLDGGAWQAASGTASWVATMHSDAVAGQQVTIIARAQDAAGNVRTTSVSVTIATSDTTAPAVQITSPGSGDRVSGSVSVSGTASDDTAVDHVEIRVDAGSWQRASGTTSWSTTVDVTGVSDGQHTFTARATDRAGNVREVPVVVDVRTTASGETVVTDPDAQYTLSPIGRTRMPQWGSVSGVLYSEQFTNRKVVFFRDIASGATSSVTLPAESLYGWSDVASVMTSPTELWILGGSGPLVARQYRLSGSPLPTSATRVSSTTMGDADSRPGDLIRLESGRLVAVWHQQGLQGPEGLRIVQRMPGSTWLAGPAISIPHTRASNQVLAQHPADGAVWLFHNADASGRIGAARLTESAGGLALTLVEDSFIVPSVHGLDGPDPENPFLAAAVDPVARTLHLAYQSADRRFFGSGSDLMIGSRVAVATIGTAGERTFDRAPVWAERVSALGLTIVDGEPVVSFLPVDEVRHAADVLQVIRHSGTRWLDPVVLGRIDAQIDRVTYAAGRAEFATRYADGVIRLRQV